VTWTFDNVLDDELITVVLHDEQCRAFQVRIGTLLTQITLMIEVSPETGHVRCNQSHALVTPLRYRAKQPGIELRNTLTFVPAFALFKVLDVMIREYRAALAAGHVPNDEWLVSR